MAADLEDIHSAWNAGSCDLLTEVKRAKWWNKIAAVINEADSSKKFFGATYIREKLRFVDEYRDRLKCEKSIVLAILLQYLHYESKLHGLNEEKTLETFAQLLQDSLEDTGTISEDNQVVLDNLERLLITAITNSAGIFLDSNTYGDLDEHYFLDFDSAILGAKPEVYQRYAELIREEYQSLSDEQYGKLRKRVLQELLTIPNVFSTREFRECYEAQARANIQLEIATLTS